MKTIICLSVALLFAVMSFSQEEKNGTIYIKHPYIEVVNKTAQTYVAKDWPGARQLYADTATWWISGMAKRVPISDAFKMWAMDGDYFDDIQQVASKGSYPDFLHYKDGDMQTVQSWWQWSGKSKKTGEVITVACVQFDDFNSAGKITREVIYGDFSKLQAAEKQ